MAMAMAMALDSGWISARESEVAFSGEQLTSTHVPSLKLDPWMGAMVPGTILATLMKNNKVLDPFYGLQNQSVPDIADAGREFYTFWFCNKFSAPQEGFKRVWLHFRAINYSGEVYVNGYKFILSKGMFLRHRLDITQAVKKAGDNNLAVLIHPPDHPGRIPAVGGQGGDHDIAKDVAAQYVEGWDWIIPIRDRNTGIWDEVSVVFTAEEVALGDTHLVSSFFDNFKRAYLHISSEVINPSSSDLKCTVHAQVTLDADDLCVVEVVASQEVEVAAGSTALCTFAPMFFYKPELWWPNGMGKQALYKVDISVNVNKVQSDTWSHYFGFRKIASFIDPATRGRQFQVNGQPVFIRGGNWIVSDGLLRLSKQRYDTDVKFHADMNLNMIRVWGGALAERPAFYDACDRHGILVWQEFWITGDCNGRGVAPSDPDWPLDHALFLDCARDTVKLLRNHASLALWVGGNEQHPPDDINSALTAELKLYVNDDISITNNDDISITKYVDPSLSLDGTRIYIQGSLWEGFAAGTGEFRDGPYEIQNPEDFFKDTFYAYGFNPEVGNVGVPSAATIRATMPPEAWDIPKIEVVSEGYVKEVPNATWELHTYIPYSQPDKKVPHQIAKYGDPKDLDDFCRKAQLVNYVQYRALMEGWNSRMWTKYTGVLIWKTQNPWPGLRGQLYDHFLDQIGGFFGVRAACEPVHVQLNLDNHKIELVNTTKKTYLGATVEVAVWDLNGNQVHEASLKNLTLPAYRTLQAAQLGYKPRSLCFLLLKLVSGKGELLSRNFYWLEEHGDYRLLEGDFASRRIPVRVSLKSSSRNGSFVVKASIQNVTGGDVEQFKRSWFGLSSRKAEAAAAKGVAFWLQISVHSDEVRGGDTRVLPVSYSHNYLSLVPGESVEVSLSFRMEGRAKPRVKLEGWNTGSASLVLPHDKDAHSANVILS